MSRLLTIPQPLDTTLSPAQRKFNQLQKQLDTARKKLQAWDEALPAFAEAFAHQVAPLRLETQQLRRQLAECLDAWLAEPKGWARGERELMRELACDLALEALEGYGLSEDEYAHWKALFDRHAEQSLDEEQAAHLQMLKSVMAEQTGLDLAQEDFATTDELLHHVREQLHQQRQQEECQAAERKAKRKPSAAQARRQAEQEAAQAQTQQTLREVFRKLASALHPDRAPDEQEAARRTALMQRVNAAYAAEDLLTLLNLQLELEQIDAQHLRRASEAQVKQFNAVLQEQLNELKAELHQRALQVCAQFELTPEREPDPTRLHSLLKDARASWQFELFEVQRNLRALSERDSAKRWIKKLKAEARSDFFW